MPGLGIGDVGKPFELGSNVGEVAVRARDARCLNAIMDFIGLEINKSLRQDFSLEEFSRSTSTVYDAGAISADIYKFAASRGVSSTGCPSASEDTR